MLDWRGRYLHARELAALDRRRRTRWRLAIAALVLAILAGVAAGLTIWRVQSDRTAAAKRRERAPRSSSSPARCRTPRRSTPGTAASSRACFSPDSRRVVSADEGGDVRVWDAATGEELARLHLGGDVLQADFSPDGSLARRRNDKGKGSSGGGGPASGSPPHRAFGLDGAVFGPDGRLVALPGDDGTIRLWDWRAGRVVSVLAGDGGVVTAVAWNPSGDLLVSASDDGAVRVWDWRARRVLATLAAGSRGVDTVAFSPDGRHVAAGSEDALARLWDWRGRRLVWSRRADSSPDVAFSPDGTIIASADTHGDVLLTDWRNRHTLARLREGGAATVTFSPDGCLVASSGYDHWARVWAPPLHGCRR